MTETQAEIQRRIVAAEEEVARLRRLADAEAAGYPVCLTSFDGHPHGCRCRDA